MTRKKAATGPIFVDPDTYVITYVVDGEVYVHVGDEDLVAQIYQQIYQETSGSRDAPMAWKVNPLTGELRSVRTVIRIELESEEE